MELLRNLKADLNNFDGTLSNVVPATLLEIANSCEKLLLHLVATVVAGLNLFEIILSSHALDEASKNVVDHISRLRAFVVVSNLSLIRLFATDEEIGELCKVLASLEELLSDEVFLQGINVCHSLLLVEQEVLGHLTSKLADVFELERPVLDSSQILRHVGASVKFLRNLEANLDQI